MAHPWCGQQKWEVWQSKADLEFFNSSFIQSEASAISNELNNLRPRLKGSAYMLVVYEFLKRVTVAPLVFLSV